MADAKSATSPDTPPSNRSRLLIAAAAFASSLTLYLLTLAPTVTLVDSGELIVAVRTLGVAHPPGFPLYVLLAHLASLAPIGSVAARVNFASALFAALAAALMTLLVAEALAASSLQSAAKRRSDKRAGQKRGGKKKAKAEGEGFTSRPETAMLAAAASGVLFAFSRTVWGYATIAEVYTLNALLILAVFLLVFRWRGRVLESRLRRQADGAVDSDRLLHMAAFTFGLAMGVHHVTVALTLPAIALLVYSVEGFGFFTSKRIARAALWALAGLAVYAYLPLAASQSPLLNWGDPDNPQRLWWHITGRQFQTFITFDPAVMAEQVKEFARFALREFGPWWLPAGLALVAFGLVAAFLRDRSMFWFLALVIAFDLAYALNYDIAEDKDAYYIPAFIAMAIASGYGAQRLFSLMSERIKPAAARRAAAALVVLFVGAVTLAGNLPYNNRSRYFIAHDYVTNILSSVEPNGLLLTLDWQVYSPMLYTREMEGLRRDVTAIDVNLLRRSWYYDYLNRSYPQLIESARASVDAFLEELRRWEQNPDLYDRDLALNQRINSSFYEMIFAFVTNHAQRSPVYVTQDIAVGAGRDDELAQWLNKTYQLVPAGLVFRLMPSGQFHAPAEPQLNMRGLLDGSLRFEQDDVVRLKVIPVYRDMLANRGRYLAAFGRHDEAIKAFEQALLIDPDYTFARQSLSESIRALQESDATERRQ